jgi:SAM-dependent methyltransferase
VSVPDAACCPSCHGEIVESRCSGCGTEFPSLDGVPVLVKDADLAAIDLRETGGELPVFDSSTMGVEAVDAAIARGDRMLELGAGLDTNPSPDLVATDAFVYGTGRLDCVADAHALPFSDASFDFVFSLAVFEHLHSPWIAAKEIARVLRPGGRVYTLAAFLQPLHGYPSHYFNASEFGLARLFEDDFEIEVAGPSRHCPHRQSLVPLYRMREMADDLTPDRSVHWRARVRAWRLSRSLTRAGYEYVQLADQMSRRPEGYASWRQIAPSVEVLAVRR